MALKQLAPAEEISEVELPGASNAAEAPLNIGRHMQPLQEMDHALLYTGWYAGVQSPCTRVQLTLTWSAAGVFTKHRSLFSFWLSLAAPSTKNAMQDMTVHLMLIAFRHGFIGADEDSSATASQ